MSATTRVATATWPRELLTLDDWDALGEDKAYRKAELVEGVLVMAPSPISGHQRSSKRLAAQLDPQLGPSGIETVQDVDVLLVAGNPPTVRCPDLVVTTVDRLDEQPKRFAAADILVAVEIISPGSRRVDRIAKLADYADAGIPNYWILDTDGPVTLDAFRLDEGRYEPVVTAATGTVTLDDPAAVTTDLTALVP